MRMSHGLGSLEYREAHGLDVKAPLLAPSVILNMREAATRRHARTPNPESALSTHNALDAHSPSLGEEFLASLAHTLAAAPDARLPHDTRERMAPWTKPSQWARHARLLLDAGATTAGLADLFGVQESAVVYRLKRYPDRSRHGVACAVIGCARSIYKEGLCSRHAAQADYRDA
ncbi:hypothetical protein GCM10009755_06030 [Brevibacterium samyangense]|uniref:Uncharacterized protein n=1 Tax=Brevibacterium samyangense TaxID=366888 RepID=A0ABN2T7G2_9MICO